MSDFSILIFAIVVGLGAIYILLSAELGKLNQKLGLLLDAAHEAKKARDKELWR
jgi:hypothetical protein